MSMDQAFQNIYKIRQQQIDQDSAMAFQGPNLIINSIAAGLDAQVKSQQMQMQMQLGVLDAQLKMEQTKTQQVLGLMEFDFKRNEAEQNRKMALDEHQIRMRDLAMREQESKVRLDAGKIGLAEKEAGISVQDQFQTYSVGMPLIDALSTFESSPQYQGNVATDPMKNTAWRQFSAQQKDLVTGQLGQQLKAYSQDISPMVEQHRAMSSQLYRAMEDIRKNGGDPNKDPTLDPLRGEIEGLGASINFKRQQANKVQADMFRVNGLPDTTKTPDGAKAEDVLKRMYEGALISTPAASGPAKSLEENLQIGAQDPGQLATSQGLDKTKAAITEFGPMVAAATADTGLSVADKDHNAKASKALIRIMQLPDLSDEEKASLAKAKEFMSKKVYSEARYWLESILTKRGESKAKNTDWRGVLPPV